MKVLLTAAALASLALLPAIASAADLPAPAPAPAYKAPAMVPPATSWTGCYGNVGYGYGVWNNDHNLETFPGLVPADGRNTSGGRGWMGIVGAGCDVEIPTGTFLGNLVFGVFGDYDFMDVHGVVADIAFQGDTKQSSAWAAGGRFGALVTPNLLAYTNGGFTQTHINGTSLQFAGIGPVAATMPAHTYNGWFLGGGVEYALNFSWMPIHGLFWRTEYRFSSWNKSDLAVTPVAGVGLFPAGAGIHQQYYEQSVLSSLVWRFNWF